MTTKQNLIRDIRIKMDIDPMTSDDYYDNYYDTLINECLSMIANAVLPYQRILEIRWGGYYEGEKSLDDLDKTAYYTIDSEMYINNVLAKRKDWLEYDGKQWIVQKKNTYGYLAKIPNDFLSFSDEASIEFRNNYGELSLNVDILYVNSTTLALSKDGDYKIYYNSEYPDINDKSKQDENGNLVWLPTSIARIIPSYVAGQLLMSEDPIKATQLKNEFELMLSRLDTNKPLVTYNINNDSGWTL